MKLFFFLRKKQKRLIKKTVIWTRANI